MTTIDPTCPVTASATRPGQDLALILADAKKLLLGQAHELEGDQQARWLAVREEILRTGTYWQDFTELSAGARLAWRNHARCVGRAAWQSLIVVDRRSCRTPKQVFAAVVEHLRAATNGGRIRPMISLFRPDLGLRIHNDQLVRYAGWVQPDGSVLGDPRNAALTDAALALGWTGPATRGRFDVLPLIISSADQPAQYFDLPADAVVEVPLTHPDYRWFADLELRWHAVPAISNMTLSVGGVHYDCAPFSGWYVDVEIGARNLSDRSRYALLRPVAERMGLDTSTTASLWMERAQIELVAAVHHSFDAAGVTIVDHHRVDGQFVRWRDREVAAGRPVPTDWAWMVSPTGASTGDSFHHDFGENHDIQPNFSYQGHPLPPRRAAGGPTCPSTTSMKGPA